MKNKEKYKGIKFLKVEQQFLNVKKIKNKSTKNLCIIIYIIKIIFYSF